MKSISAYRAFIDDFFHNEKGLLLLHQRFIGGLLGCARLDALDALRTCVKPNIRV
jgi:hypothetical protein